MYKQNHVENQNLWFRKGHYLNADDTKKPLQSFF